MTNKKPKKSREPDDKGAEQRGLGERFGRKETEPATHPASRESGIQGASNVGEDETSGSE